MRKTFCRTPSGVSINGRGIDPDALVEFSERPQSQYRGPAGRVAAANDPQLGKALELLGLETIELSSAR